MTTTKRRGRAEEVNFDEAAQSLVERFGGRIDDAEELAAQVAREQAEVEVAARLSRMRSRGIPRGHARKLAGEELIDTPALGYTRRWFSTPMTLLVLGGKPGCGKTQAAAWCVAQRSFRRYDSPEGTWPGELMPQFIDVSKLARLSRYDESVMRPLEQCSLLAIDDMGQEYVDQKGFFHSLVDGLINARHADELKTVITTNLSRPDFEERYGGKGGRVADRLRDGRYFGCPGDSLRGAR